MEQPHLPFGQPSTKRCNACGEVKSLDDFHRARKARDGRQHNCKVCNIAINKQWYRDHPEVRPDRMDEYARQRHRRNHRRLFDYLLEHPCVDCGENDPVVLEFDHLRDKVKNVSAMMGHPWWKVVAEIAKCEVVCANCHRRRTVARLGGLRYLLAQELSGVGAPGIEPETRA